MTSKAGRLNMLGRKRNRIFIARVSSFVPVGQHAPPSDPLPLHTTTITTTFDLIDLANHSFVHSFIGRVAVPHRQDEHSIRRSGKRVRESGDIDRQRERERRTIRHRYVPCHEQRMLDEVPPPSRALPCPNSCANRVSSLAFPPSLDAAGQQPVYIRLALAAEATRRRPEVQRPGQTDIGRVCRG